MYKRQEYNKLKEQVESFKPKFKKIALGRPLLTSIEDYKETVEAVRKQLEIIKPDEAVVFMGHGTTHESHAAYPALEYMFRDNDMNVYIGTVEGYPEIEQVVKKLKADNIKTVDVLPLMLVAGEHATNDLSLIQICAAAASKAATYMLITQKKLESVNIDTPKGIYLTLKPENIEINKKYAICSIQKDGGDDIDATHKMDIFAKAEIIDRINEEEDIYVTGGIGVGTVTKKGLKVEVGKSAINPVPMNMIKTEIHKVLGTDLNTYIDKSKTLKITISAPEGVETVSYTHLDVYKRQVLDM